MRRLRRLKRRARGGLTISVFLLIVGLTLPITSTTRLELFPPKLVRVKATQSEKNHNRDLALAYAQAGYGYRARERACLLALWDKESRWDHYARNFRSTAYGIAQLLSETSREPAIQILHGLRYIQHRYSNSACKALKFHDTRGWY